MRQVRDWTLADGSLLLNFSDDVRSVFERNVQVGDLPESGGVLLGTVHERGLLVTVATTPTRLDRQLRYLFERLPFGHRAVAKRKWRQSAGTTRYIGEWHTHPQDIPVPSSIDLDEWRKLAKKRADKRPLLAVIVGRHGLHVELAHGNGHREQLTPYID
ncbi:Mov34/MPN/PAD-1 family protein [Phenylobacterium sp.]|uniref:Mov34/MPN/PAD-1 family protein n=1 Tax=Phenylobacterium sp. TaxID=1871053 RepID=UPI0027359558|nr:Mov34/MPN/PAD-1 family protein [Phenylobacterium sp.]MDP3659569.1 Mov34/MPN/PAD-1 family protein [Phenylobacterium sp.]